MTLVSTTSSSTIGGLLFPGADQADDIQQLLKERRSLEPAIDAMRTVPSTLAHAASAEVGSIIARLLDIDLVDALVSGWKKYGALSSAAEATLWTPGEEQVVEIATHRVSSTHAPSVDLVVDGINVGSIDFEIELSAVVHAMCAVVSGGKLVAFRSGRIELSATLSCEGVEMKSIRRELDPSLELDLGDGVPLVESLGNVWLPDPPPGL